MLTYVLTILTFIFLIAAVQMYNKPAEEGFRVQSISPLQHININYCPQTYQTIQTAKGNTDCCSESMIDGKCPGKTFCTKSPTHDDIPTCISAWRSYYADHGRSKCPSTMPNYFEDILNPRGRKGCSASKTTPDGKAPSDPKQKQCTIYADEKDNYSKPDSCYIEKERLNTKCPVVGDQRPTAEPYIINNKFAAFQCRYRIEPQIPTECIDDKSYTRYINTFLPTSAFILPSMRETKFCSTLITRRQKAIEEQRRLAEEKRRREEAERKLKEAQNVINQLRDRLSGFFRRFRR